MNEILEGNKLIAEFMQEENISAIFQTEPFVTEVRISYNMINELEKQGAEVRLYYHDNWNKLMPVVEKIEGLGYETLIKQGWHEPKEKKMNEVEIRSNKDGLVAWACEMDKKEATVQAIIQFILWYNQNNK